MINQKGGFFIGIKNNTFMTNEELNNKLKDMNETKNKILKKLFTFKLSNDKKQWIINCDFINNFYDKFLFGSLQKNDYFIIKSIEDKRKLQLPGSESHEALYRRYKDAPNLDKEDSINSKISFETNNAGASGSLLLFYNKEYQYNGSQIVNKIHKLGESLDKDKNYLSLEFYIFDKDSSKKNTSTSFERTKAFFINDELMNENNQILTNFKILNEEIERKGIIYCHNEPHINEIIINEILKNTINENENIKNKYSKNIINYITSFVSQTKDKTKYSGITMTKSSGTLSSLVESINKYSLTQLKDDEENKKKLFNFIDNKVIKELCELLSYLKSKLMFIHGDLTINNIFFNILDDNNNVIDFNKRIYEFVNDDKGRHTFIMEIVDDKYKFNILLADFDKSTLYYKNIKFSPSMPGIYTKFFVENLSDINSFNKNKNYINMWYWNRVYGFNTEFLSYYARTSPISIFPSYDYYIFIYSLFTFFGFYKDNNDFDISNDYMNYIIKNKDYTYNLLLNMFNESIKIVKDKSQNKDLLLSMETAIQYLPKFMEKVRTNEDSNKYSISHVLNNFQNQLPVNYTDFESDERKIKYKERYDSSFYVYTILYNFKLNKINNYETNIDRFILSPQNDGNEQIKLILSSPLSYNDPPKKEVSKVNQLLGYFSNKSRTELIIPENKTNLSSELEIKNNDNLEYSISEQLKERLYFKTNKYSKLSNLIRYYYDFNFIDYRNNVETVTKNLDNYLIYLKSKLSEFNQDDDVINNNTDVEPLDYIQNTKFSNIKEDYFKKYIKYKNKYLELKNKLFI
jgi:hypothetical protein